MLQQVPGLHGPTKFLCEKDQTKMLEQLEQLDFTPAFGRSGREWSHNLATYTPIMNVVSPKADPIPEWMHSLGQQLLNVPSCRSTDPDRMGHTVDYFNQVIVNRYLPGESISAHTYLHTFGDTIACVSLGATGTMIFHSPNPRHRAIPIQVEPGTVYVITKEARRSWKHELQPMPNGPTRYSITYRHVPSGLC